MFSHVDLKFIPGNCYGVIGANGAGKSTFLKILSGELEPTAGSVVIPARTRLSVLKQDHAAFDTHTVLDTVLLGNPRLVEIMREKDELYAKEDFTDEDGERASHLEGEFAELNGWEADSDAARLLQGLGLSSDVLTKQMKELPDREKVKVLLAQALFGQPDILLLD
ncbi:MAG: ATP-binding cassette domain-containing protein, partial [Oscillospiraceae bacterium]|nr:ATP-binding cassette domain-containing protein [Oscillospiraceae bacterium]